MKLSNKILIGFFGFIFLYLTAAFAEVRFRGTPTIIDDTNSIAETVDIPGINYLILPDLEERIYVSGSDKPKLEVRSINGDLLKQLEYTISGDTLVLNKLNLKENTSIRVTVFVSNSTFKGITVNGAIVQIENLDQGVLEVHQKSGRLSLKNSNIDTLRIAASEEASFDLYDSDLNILSAQIDNSEVLIYSPANVLNGSMKNDSFLRLNSIDEIQFKKDESSRLYLY